MLQLLRCGRIKMNNLSKKNLQKMEQMLKAIQDPNFEANLKKAANKLKKQSNKVTEMDIVKEMNNE